MSRLLRCCLVMISTFSALVPASLSHAQERDSRLRPQHWFDLELASDARISPDGHRIVYVRRYADIMTDRNYSNIWLVNVDGTGHRPLTTGKYSESSPRWSHDGTRVAFVSDRQGGSAILVRFMHDGQLVRVTNTPNGPSNLSWSPDDEWLAFTMPVSSKPPDGIKMPTKPKGADWADPPVVIDKLIYRFDKRGYLKDEYTHIFVVPYLGGTPRQLTDGDYNHGAPDWAPDGSRLYFSATRKPDAEWIVQNSEVYSVTLDGQFQTLTSRDGPDDGPVVSPDGKLIAYTGFDEKNFSYTITRLWVMNADGTEPRVLTPSLDRTVRSPRWSADGKRVYFLAQSEGSMHVQAADLNAKVVPITNGVRQVRAFTVAANDQFAGVLADPAVPADVVAFTRHNPEPVRLTRVNDDLLAHLDLGTSEAIWYQSSFDQKRLQGWILKPPGFDPAKKYPLVLYIHGGPHAMYGVNFNFEFQVHAANDRVIFYCNPRGSTGYGEEFGNIIQYNYPGDDFFDLMSGVDQVISRGYIDPENLFVTGGSGGGVLTCWVIGRTERFAAAVSQYPVINWYSFVLTSDITGYVKKRWFRGYPWEDLEGHMNRSPIAKVGNVTTPTLLITGTEDWRTPISETEQYYQALKIQKKETRMVRVPAESHGIRGRPSHYIAKILHIAKWFDDHRRGNCGEPSKDESEND